MFDFDGSYRRVPIQSLGGTSQNSDRETLIKKSQQERQKRAEVRKQNNGATVIQSYARSFILRQRIKQEQRKIFDDFMSKQIENKEQLGFLLQRILFFYYRKNQRDGERLVSQFFCEIVFFFFELVRIVFVNIFLNFGQLRTSSP